MPSDESASASVTVQEYGSLGLPSLGALATAAKHALRARFSLKSLDVPFHSTGQVTRRSTTSE